MQTPPQTPKPILKRLFFRLSTTFRRKHERPAIGTSISESTQISTQLDDPPAIESGSGTKGVSFRRKVLQTVTVVTNIGASVAEAVPGGTIAKGALDAFCKVLKVVELNLQNKDDVDELRSKIEELVDDLSESTIPAGDVAFEARQRTLPRKLRAKAEELEELLEDPCARIRSLAISQAIAACFRDVETFKMDFLVMVAQHQMRRNDLLVAEMAKQTAALEVFVELQQSGPSTRFLATVKVMDPLGRPHMVPREFVNAFKDLGQYILDEWSSNPNVQGIIAPYIAEGRYDLTVNSGKTITEIAIGNKPYVAEPNETIVMSVVEFRDKFYGEKCIGCGSGPWIRQTVHRIDGRGGPGGKDTRQHGSKILGSAYYTLMTCSSLADSLRSFHLIAGGDGDEDEGEGEDGDGGEGAYLTLMPYFFRADSPRLFHLIGGEGGGGEGGGGGVGEYEVVGAIYAHS